ncbi:MAG TPA: rhomboid family intramembrane serine protease [Methylosinus sp.]|jgi:rhomboid protease GluP|uniref:rhomboid family intramembrane serine protease n=1 Tax=Methylosinus sp. TaxID=427 RepID=UPI002F952904
MTAEHSTHVEIRRATKKLLLIFVGSLLFTAGGVFMTLHPDERHGLAAGVLVLAFFGLCTLVALWQLIQARKPAFILTDRDFSSPSIVSGPVSWGDVQNVYMSVANNQKLLHLTLYPVAADRLERAGFLAWLGGLFGWRSREIVFPLSMLDVEPDKLATFVATRVEEAKEQQTPEAAALARESAPVEPKVERVAPYFAMALSIVLAAIFACELGFAPFPATDAITPAVGTLVVMGGSSLAAVRDGEWWRLFTAPLLHGGLFHLLLNVVALIAAGSQLERLVGAAWFAGVFCVGALAGSTASVFFNPPDIVGVGTSGGVVALFAATAVASYRFPPGPERNNLLTGSFQILLPSLLPLVSISHGAHIDYAAHFGGAAGGLLCGLALLPLWPIDRPRPRFGKFPAALAAAFFVVAFGSATLIPPRLAQARLLAPDFPLDWDKARADSAAILARYPRDPRARLAHGAWLADHGSRAEAEKELRDALADAQALNIPGMNHMEPRIRLLLAMLIRKERPEEARNVVAPICASALPDFLVKYRNSTGLCP